jgi:hypothetical protein
MTTTARRRELAELARSRGSGGRSGGWRTAAIVLLALAILGAGAAWALGAFSGPREVRELRSLVEQETQRLERVARGEVAFDDGSSGFSAVFEQARAVPEPYRRAVWQDMGRLFEARESAEVQSFFRMPAAERQAELDRRIKAEEQRRQARDAARAQGGDRGPRGGGTPPGGRPSAGGPTGAVPATGTAGTAGGGGTQRGGRGWTEEDRNRRYKASIDRSTPEQRAMRTEYRRLMQERRTQLGLSNRRW